MYIVNLFFLGDAEESSTAASTVPNVILTSIKNNLCMKPWDKLIWNRNLVIAISAYHSSFIFERVEICLKNLTLLNNKLIFFIFVSTIGMCNFSLNFWFTDFWILLHFSARPYFTRFLWFSWGKRFDSHS